MPKIAAGVVKFQREAYHDHKELFEELATGQSPEALFITCSDSRIDPSLVTSTRPGELFICRNAGNIVPPHTNQTGGMTASIEYAVAALKVPHIVICGHTECGAMKGAMDVDALDALPHVKQWLSFARAALQVVDETEQNLSEADRLNRLIDQNVLMQMAHIRTHPYVAAALANGSVQLHGWVYDIRTGDVRAYNEATGKFEPVDERYADIVREHMPAHAH